MNIMVYDVQADSGGAATVLEYFYNIHKKDLDNHYYYILSVYHLEETDNITVVNVPYVKNSWLHRLWFDFIGVREYVKKFGIEEVLSLQNTMVPNFDGFQTLYEHNALPFSEYNFSFFENKKMWVYQNIIGKFMISSIKKVDKVIVQTEWMKQAICKKANISEYKVEVDFPKVDIPDRFHYAKQDHTMFFYPANSAPFKNHKVIIKACRELKKKGIENYSVVFTLLGKETAEIEALYQVTQRENLPIHWIGPITREEVFEYYSKSTLIFPSFIETVGLPIIEAGMVGCPILLSNCNYSKEFTKHFSKTNTFDYNNHKELARLMCQNIGDTK